MHNKHISSIAFINFGDLVIQDTRVISPVGSSCYSWRAHALLYAEQVYAAY